MKKVLVSIWLFIGILVSSNPAAAAESDTDKLIDLLTEKGLIKKDEAAGLRADIAIKKQEEKQPPVIGMGNEGFFIKSADGDFQLKFRGLVNLDGRFFHKNSPHDLNGTNQFLLRRARGYFEGTMFRYFDFRVMPEFGQGKSELFDAYTDITYFPEAKLKLGRFVTPVGLTFLQPDPDGNFVERSLVTNLLPFRDIGVQLHGELFGGTLCYAVGVFNGAPDGGNSDSDANNNKELDGRIMVEPFRLTEISFLKGLGVGISGTTGDPHGDDKTAELPAAFKTQSQEKFFTYETGNNNLIAIADGKRQRISPQMYYYWDSLGILAEYAKSTQKVALAEKNSGNVLASDKLSNDAWQVSVSYILTGEKNAYKGGITPQRSWGALELAGRYARLDVNENAFPVYANPDKSAKRVVEYTLGLNWYLTRNIRFMLDYGQAFFKGGSPLGHRKNENIVLSRWQLAF